MSKLVLFGTGRGADVAYRFLTRDSDHEVCGFATDRAYLTHRTFHGLPVVAFEDIETAFPPDAFHMLILLGYQGMNSLRAEKYFQAKQKGYRLASYVCSDLFQAQDLQIGENCFILDNQSISLDVHIGNNVVMWSSNHIGDLTRIEDHAWISSHVTIAAEVVVKEACFVGIGAKVSNNVTLGARSFVGANALVTSDTAADSVQAAGESPTVVDVDSATFMKVLRARKKL
jgi:sugar O-acyltransferase (sialic acid O-acetyltransferase NeuD family)